MVRKRYFTVIELTNVLTSKYIYILVAFEKEKMFSEND